MTGWGVLEERISQRLRLSHGPVAVTFLDAEPENMTKFIGAEPSGCSFWRLAAEGRSFFTVPSDHFNCAVGSYTHNIDLSPERALETEQTLAMMFRAGYIRLEEVPGIPRLAATPAVVAYSPLAETTVSPSVVLFACRPASAMLLQESAIRAGKAATLPALGRPTCMALPAALSHGTVISLGCIGNRVYTGLGEEEIYVVVRGVDLTAVADGLDIIASANTDLAAYAQGRRGQIATA